MPLVRALSLPGNPPVEGGKDVPSLRPELMSSFSEPSAHSLSSPLASQVSGVSSSSGSAASLMASSSLSTTKDSTDCGEKNRSVQTLLLQRVGFEVEVHVI